MPRLLTAGCYQEGAQAPLLHADVPITMFQGPPPCLLPERPSRMFFWDRTDGFVAMVHELVMGAWELTLSPEIDLRTKE